MSEDRPNGESLARGAFEGTTCLGCGEVCEWDDEKNAVVCDCSVYRGGVVRDTEDSDQ